MRTQLLRYAYLPSPPRLPRIAGSRCEHCSRPYCNRPVKRGVLPFAGWKNLVTSTFTQTSPAALLPRMRTTAGLFLYLPYTIKAVSLTDRIPAAASCRKQSCRLPQLSPCGKRRSNAYCCAPKLPVFLVAGMPYIQLFFHKILSICRLNTSSIFISSSFPESPVEIIIPSGAIRTVSGIALIP